MNKIFLIIKREYLTRVKKKSFILMTILGPVIMASIMIVPIYIATKSASSKTVAIVDESGFFTEGFKGTKDLKFINLHMKIETAKDNYDRLGADMILYIPQPAYTFPSEIYIYSKKQPGMIAESYIRSSINDDLRQLRLKKRGISTDIIEEMKTSIDVSTIKLKDDGTEEESMATRDFILGLVGGILIYFFIFMYGAQVMRGVIEEKTSRIVEIIISSVRPFQLMMGKIVGVAMVGLTQFVLWVILTLSIVGSFQVAYYTQITDMKKQETLQLGQAIDPSNPLKVDIQKDTTSMAMEAISTINFPVIIGGFLFYFLFGYLLYAALFAAVGSAVDNETDTQQFMLPLTVPLILSIVMAQFIAGDPDGSVSFWFSIFPLTSSIAMMIRLPFGIPIWQVALSMSLLIGGFILATWFAGKVYRTGILMYGKKPSYKEVWKWFKQSN